jgi:hypothetical protein
MEAPEYTFHKNLLCSSSEFFSVAFAGQMKEGLSGRIHLPEETPESFDIFAEWLYTRRLPSKILVERLLNIYFLADRYQVPKLHEQCFVRFIKRYGTRAVPCDEILKLLLTRPHGRLTCPLRSYYVELYSYLILTRKKRTQWIRILELDQSFAADVALEMARIQMGPAPDSIEHPLYRSWNGYRQRAGSRERATGNNDEEG